MPGLPPALIRLQAYVWRDVNIEGVRAHEKHKDGPLGSFAELGMLNHDERLSYLVEKVGEVARALQDWRGAEACRTHRAPATINHFRITTDQVAHLREELIQVAHLASLWAAVLDEEAVEL